MFEARAFEFDCLGAVAAAAPTPTGAEADPCVARDGCLLPLLRAAASEAKCASGHSCAPL